MKFLFAEQQLKNLLKYFDCDIDHAHENMLSMEPVFWDCSKHVHIFNTALERKTIFCIVECSFEYIKKAQFKCITPNKACYSRQLFKCSTTDSVQMYHSEKKAVKM